MTTMVPTQSAVAKVASAAKTQALRPKKQLLLPSKLSII